MKIWIPALALALCLAGCAGRTEPAASPEGTASPPPAVTAAPTPTPTPTPTPPAPSAPAETEQPSPAPAGPSDEAVLEAYSRAEEAWSWFTVAPPELDRGAVLERDGRSYCRVDDPRFSTLSELRGYLKGLFSDRLVEELLPIDGVQFLEEDGALYAVDGGRGADITRGAQTVQVLRDEGEPDRVTVRVTVEVLDPEAGYAPAGEETHDFTYERVGERWLFTAFSAVR